MTTHLSVRLCWHDSGWNGQVCRSPMTNRYCTALDHIREVKDKDFEKKIEKPNRETQLSGLSCEEVTMFPCRGEICVFSQKGYSFKLEHPLKKKVHAYNLAPCTVEPVSYSFYPAPYRWLAVKNYEDIIRNENLQIRSLNDNDRFYYTARGKKKKDWVDDVRLQEVLLNRFWEKLDEYKSLVVFYSNSTPVAEDTKRVVVGLGRLARKYKMSQFGRNPERPGPNWAWQRQLSHNFPEEGFRLPYQEYLEQGVDPSNILVTVPEEVDEQFKYVAEHVSDDAMLSLAERLSRAIGIIIEDVNEGRVKLNEDWHRHRSWLQRVIGELWQNRGQYPGIGSVLRFLGFGRGMTYHKEVLTPLQMQNFDTLQHTVDILDGKAVPEENFKDDFGRAQLKWMLYSKDPERRQLLTLLMRIELTKDQVDRLVKQQEREESGVRHETKELIDNPYLIAEDDRGLLDEKGVVKSEKISLDAIDHAMIPAFNFPGRYEPDDHRRVRAIMVEVLKKAAEQGDTLLSTNELMDALLNRFHEEERKCTPDFYIVKAFEAFFKPKIDFTDDYLFVALNEIREYEILVSSKMEDIVKVEYSEKNPDWDLIIDARFGKAKVNDQLEKKARDEKKVALEVLYNRKLSVLTGRAGTGKTEVVNLLIEGIIESEKTKPDQFLVLAPTGKARIRLRRNFNDRPSLTEIEPMTIHQHLNGSDWLERNWDFKQAGGSKTSPATVIVDECSMMSIDLFATLLKSLELNSIKRLVLVGDPNQLPPIGPGRPFDDIVKWLEEDDSRKKNAANLKIRMRHKQEEKDEDRTHMCLQLADGFLRDFKSKDIEEVYTTINKGELDQKSDLFFAEWKEYDDLLKKLDQILEQIEITDYVSYKRSVGISDGDFSKVESWQVLSPLKHREVSGTISLNSYLQDKLLGRTLTNWRARADDPENPGHKCPLPFGKTKDIVYEDKVIQTRNTPLIRCTPPKSDRYVANGEIGLVTSYENGTLGVVFSDQLDREYIYYNNEKEQGVETNLDQAYAITIHKSQGSDFEKVIVILPERAFNISMEMMYTALTRFKGKHGKTFLLVQGGIDTLEHYRRASSSETDRRNTHLFKVTVRDDVEHIPYAENRIHRTKNGFLVRSKSEVIVANELISAGISLTEKNYESKLYSKDGKFDYKLPDLTFESSGKRFYWEHLGMLSLDSYRKSWERKSQWYETNGYSPQLIVSKDGPDGSIDSQTINKIIQERIGINPRQKDA